jgi:hypothetical protein
VNVKKPSLAAWKLLTRPKMKGGLGVLNLNLHNCVLLMKQLHKFFFQRGFAMGQTALVQILQKW